ncbi:LacI family transcriptional regulator [Klebsiella pneumoniae]|uniref:LacI family transcriptional regulator n=1 Tax=Klebsiella pneumoniae TaxID=573 RepID=A0A377TSX6_KLEPN|nr:LacI family transcriptional regulator [Klebsiella pneumoniae]
MPERVVAFDHRVCIANRVTRQAQRHRPGRAESRFSAQANRDSFLSLRSFIATITLKKIATKITLADIAREARVGVATVDRVLNKRAAVKESTARRVLEAARRLGFTLEQPH